MAEEKQVNNFIFCSRCAGGGTAEQKKCEQCLGLGGGFVINNKFFYWGKILDSLHIAQERLHRAVKKVINLILFLAGLAGFVLLLWFFYLQEIFSLTGFFSLFSLSFWSQSHILLLAFWFSILLDCYLFYKIAKEREKIVFVESRKYGEREKSLPSTAFSWKEIKNFKKEQKIDISESFTPEALKIIENAYKFAKKSRHNQLRPEVLFYNLLLNKKILTIFARLGVDFESLRGKLGRSLNKISKGGGETRLAPRIKKILLGSYKEAYLARQRQVTALDILLSLARAESPLKEILFDMEIDEEKIFNVVNWIRIRDNLRRNLKKFKKAARLKPGSAMNRAMTAVATPYLDRFSEDLTWLAKAGYLAPCVNREQEINEIFRVIEGGKESVILVGNQGVGKNSIIEGIAWRMVEEDVPQILQDKRLVNLSIARLIGGATPAEAEERLLRLLWEIRRAGNIVLVIPKIEDMIGITAGGEESLDLSEVLASEITKGGLLIMATALESDYAKYIENKAIGAVLKKIKVKEMERNAAIQVVEVKSGAIEYQNKIFFSYGAIEAAVDLSSRYIHEQNLPTKAIDLTKEAAVEVKNKKGAKSIIKAEDIAAILAGKINIPLTKITEEESKKLLNLEELMHKSIIGQEEAVEQVASALRRARAELRETNRPIASFLFLGPTGVGKTELAKTLARVYFGRKESMIRLDMSEYQEQMSIYRLIGAPDGKSLGYLTEAARKNPFSLLLLDEMEKAHKDILNLFLQVMDDGRLTDSQGRTIDFTNVVLIATSNAGTTYIQDEVKNGIPLVQIKQALINRELRKHYRPEFLNRFDAIIVFKPLTKEEIKKIAVLMLKKVTKRLEDKGITFKATEEAVKELAAKGFDPVFGARPMRRLIQDTVDNALAEYLLKGKLGRRDVAILEPGGIIRVEKAEKL